MKLMKFEDDELRRAAQLVFQDKYIAIECSDIFLKGASAGKYKAEWLNREFYVSTEYAYEDILVNGNPTRYKISISCILVKDNAYQVVFDSQDMYYVAYQENNEIKFMKYKDLIPTLSSQLELLEELQPV